MILNTQAVKATSSTDATATGGLHWQACVVLPKHYTAPFGGALHNDREVIYYLDSLYQQVMPQTFKHLLTSPDGFEYSFDTDIGIKVHQIPPLFPGAQVVDNLGTNQQQGGEDCGWWAVYNALMIVLTGRADYLGQFQVRSREPAFKLRAIFDKMSEQVGVEKISSPPQVIYGEAMSAELQIAILLQHYYDFLSSQKSRQIEQAETLAINLAFIKLSEKLSSMKLSSLQDSSVAAQALVRHHIYFPRCEYYTRFQGSTLFDMVDKQYWGTYFRSTARGGGCDRLASNKKAQKHFEDTDINPEKCRTVKRGKNKGEKKVEKVQAAKSGNLYSPFYYQEYGQIVNQPTEALLRCHIKPSIMLYDALLSYRQTCCEFFVSQVKAQARSLKYVKTIYINSYPCIMVHASTFNFQGANIEDWHKISMACYVAIVNNLSYTMNVPVELVIRSSFGHNIPSVAETDQTFRINIGIVPKVYVKILAMGIMQLDHLIGRLLETEVFYSDTNYKLLDLLSSKVTKNTTYIHEITRFSYYVDFIADKLYLVIKRELPLKDMWEQVLAKISKTTSVTVKLTDEDLRYRLNANKQGFQPEENQEITQDYDFWRILNEVSKVFNTGALNSNVASKRIHGLYKALEQANLLLIKEACTYNGKGEGSDSDVEEIDHNFFSRKLTFVTGMKAINVAIFLTQYFCHARSLGCLFSAELMYYETKDIITSVSNVLEKVFPRTDQYKTVAIQCIDLTHCSSLSKAQILPLDIFQRLPPGVPVILDYTSATTNLIRFAIYESLKRTSVVLLLSSGLKNEQVGADINPYGTVRIISSNKEQMLELYQIGLSILKRNPACALPKTAHQIRKAYKELGCSVTNSAIYKESVHYNYDSQSVLTPEHNYDIWLFIEHHDEIKELHDRGLSSSDVMHRYNYFARHLNTLDDELFWELFSSDLSMRCIIFLNDNSIIDQFIELEELLPASEKIMEIYTTDGNDIIEFIKSAACQDGLDLLEELGFDRFYHQFKLAIGYFFDPVTNLALYHLYENAEDELGKSDYATMCMLLSADGYDSSTPIFSEGDGYLDYDELADEHGLSGSELAFMQAREGVRDPRDLFSVRVYYNNVAFNYINVHNLALDAYILRGKNLQDLILELSQEQLVIEQVLCSAKILGHEVLLYRLLGKDEASVSIHHQILKTAYRLGGTELHSLVLSLLELNEEELVPAVQGQGPEVVLHRLLGIEMHTSKALVFQNPGPPALLDKVYHHNSEALLPGSSALQALSTAPIKQTAINSWISSYLKGWMYRAELKQLGRLLQHHNIDVSAEEALTPKGFRQLSLKLHPDKGGNKEDFAFVRGLRAKFDSDVDTKTFIDFLQPKVHDLNVVLKFSDTAVDALRLCLEPTVHNLKAVALDAAHLSSMTFGFSKVSSVAAILSVGHTYYSEGLAKAASQGVVSLGYMVVAYALTFTGIPYVGFAYGIGIAGYSAYHSANNAYALYNEYTSEQSELRSATSYMDMFKWAASFKLDWFEGKALEYEIKVNSIKLHMEQEAYQEKLKVEGEFGQKIYEHIYEPYLQEKYSLLNKVALKELELEVANKQISSLLVKFKDLEDYDLCREVSSNDSPKHYYCANEEKQLLQHIAIVGGTVQVIESV